MKCPACNFLQPDNSIECSKCGIIFRKWNKPPSNSETLQESPTDATSDATEQPSPKISTFLFALLLLVVCIYLEYLLIFPKGLPIRDNSYTNTKHNFAIYQPSDWILFTKENYEEIFNKYKNLLQTPLKNLLSNPNIVMGIIKMTDGVVFAPSCNVVSIKGRMPTLTEEEKEKGTALIVDEYKKYFKDFTQDSSEIVKIDKLNSLKIVIQIPFEILDKPKEPLYEESPTGAKRIIGHTDEVWKKYRIKLLQYCIPGEDEAYILSCTADVADYPKYEPELTSIIESFRVLKRPPILSGFLGGALKGGLTGMIFYLLYYIGLSIYSFSKR